MPKSWAHRLGALLPDDARRELFLPALADLDHDRARRSTGAGRHALAVIVLFLDCLRLQIRAPRKDLAAMFVRDVRQSFRIFRREPGFAAAAVVMLALGIGANTALFAVVEAVLLRPLPFAKADEVVLIKHRDTGTGLTKWDIGDRRLHRSRARDRSRSRPWPPTTRISRCWSATMSRSGCRAR